MDKLFGVPINQLMVILLVVFGVGVIAMSVIALRNRVVLKVGIRNIPRRRAQTALIVLGLMLATLLFSASFAVGDTLTHSIRVSAVTQIGEVDVVVRSVTRDASGRYAYFEQAGFELVHDRLSDTPGVAGVAPLVHEVAPVVAPATRLSEPQVNILGYDERWMDGFDRLVDEQGRALPLGALTSAQVYASKEVAQKLDIKPGDTVQAFLGPQPSILTVAGFYERGANPAGELSIAMPQAVLQTLTGNEGRINSIIITNQGDAIQGATHTDAVLSAIEPVLQDKDMEAIPVKRDALDDANTLGSTFSAIFLLFGQFSIAAGILLIFLIFVMLAAERKRELGIARAVGTQRGHVVRMFAYEGAAYALLAAAVGSVLGVVVGWGMVRIMTVAFGQVDLELTYAFRWQSVVIAYTLGMVLTFLVVLISSWRVSRLNIVRAIRDLPEPRGGRRTIKGLVLLIALPLIGILLTLSGLQAQQLGTFMLGTSLVIIGLPLLARRFGLPDRPAFTIAGLGLVIWWLLPSDVLAPVLPDMTGGMEMFFLSGILIVLGAVWAIIYNSEMLLAGMVFVFGRMRGFAPVLKTAVSYSMQNRFRTGITLAMFSLIVFTLMVMAFILTAIAGVFDDTDRLSGGFQIRADTSYANPIADIRADLTNAGVVNLDNFQAIGTFVGAPVKVMQEGTTQEPDDFFVQGADAGYTDNVTYQFAMMAPEYSSPRAVWQALQAEPGTAVVPSWMVPTRNNYNMTVGGPDFRLSGFWLEDEVLPEVYVRAQDPRTGNEQRLRIIGVLETTAFYSQGITTSQGTVNALLPSPALPQSYMFRMKDDGDASAAAKALKAQFLEHGMQAEVMAEEIRKNASTNLMINNLLQGFMGLGLVVGIAALGVIAARAVVERRQQIGVMRALGFQKSMVQFSFLLESSYVALLGIAMGIALGVGLSYSIVNEIGKQMEGVRFIIPWLNIAVVAIIAYGAALLTTYLPARQAAQVYPAEALRFE